MPARCTLRRFLAVAAACLLTVAAVMATGALGSIDRAFAAAVTTAWRSGAFSVDTSGVVSRSDIVLGQPNTVNSQSLPLGNGSLGVAAWAANGFTAELNRSDTMPNRLSPGQVRIPGLAAMTSASDFTGTLDLYDGMLDESGGGMTMQAWVPAGKDELIVNVTGANPGTRQTANLYLWNGRTPATAASGAIGSLAQTWVDNSQSGSSGQTFGAMAAITAGGQNVTASVVSSTEVQVSFNPNSDGSFRVIIASPQWTGGDPASTASNLIDGDTTTTTSSLLSAQSSWWNNYWAHTGLIEANSPDGTAQYMENLRTIYLYAEAASMHRGDYPGSQAGVADMFAYDQDQQDWYPAGYWLWNLRGQIAANLSSGNYNLNLPIFDMYLNDLPAIESWTSAQMGGKPGACVPETMRFNGNGYYGGGSNSQNASCATASNPSFNAETITSGAEIALWIWQQYQDTGSISFLQKYYPVLQQAATFLLAWQNVGSDGFLHAVANAHETQWSVQDPTTDLAADQALFPATISAATLLNTDSSLVAQLKTALTQIEPYARTDAATKTQMLTPSADASGNDVIADSFQPSATLRNGENIGLEPVWPYGVITDNTTVNGDDLTALADRTYASRPNQNGPDWSYDAVDAARLDMSSQVASDLVANTEGYQAYISGLANLSGNSPGDEPYLEQSSDVATAMNEALATDYDGTLHIAPAWPSGWDASGTVYIQGGSKVDVQVEGGVIATAAIEAGTTETMTVRNPWPGQQAEVVDGSTGTVVISPTTSTTFSVPVTAGSSYLIEQPSSPTTSLPFAQVTGTQATFAKHLGGKVQIGLDSLTRFPSLAAAFNNVGIVDDSNTAVGGFDGPGGASFSAQTLAVAGISPGAAVWQDGMTFTWPNVPVGSRDNVVASGQTIPVSGSGTTLGVFGASANGTTSGAGKIVYTDGSTQAFSLSYADWWSQSAAPGSDIAATLPYIDNGQGRITQTVHMYFAPVPLQPGKTVAAVVLPYVSADASSGTAAMHIFAVGISSPSTQVISLRAHANGMIVTAENAGASALIANRTAIGGWEKFDLIDLGNGKIALRAQANNMIVCADSAGASPLIANRTAVGPWETFTLIHNADGSISLKAQADGDYVTADNAGAQPLIANRTAIGPWEEFDLINDSASRVISLRAHANGMIVTADNAGASPLIANRTAIGGWEQFDEIDLPSGDIALLAHANGMIVTADNAGSSPLIANSTAIGTRQTFTLIHNADGSISLKAQANGNYVTAENAGALPLIANRTAVGGWEEFDLIND